MNSKIEKTVEFRIHRFNPEKKHSYVSTFKVPVRKGMTLLQALMYIKDNLDGTLAFRHSCRMGICGSCGIMVNGKPVLACYTQVLHLSSPLLVLEPLQNMTVIKDLIVDVQPFFETYSRINTVLIKPEAKLAEPTEFIQSTSELHKYWDTTLCIKCSICYSACPAALDERFLGPSTLATNYRFILDSRDEGKSQRLKPLADNLWLCTSCNSCTLFCPKEVDCSASIVGERRLVVETGVFPRTAKEVLANTSKFHNPLGKYPTNRIAWATGEVKTFPSTSKADVLLFVGCLPSYDPRSQQIANAMISVFKRLNVDYATLGTEEWCCGDHMLRLGEEGLFEELAEHNLEKFRKFAFKKVVALSPHCYNTFKNDKPYVDAEMNVQHYTQFLAETLRQRELEVSKSTEKTVVYHDPCFLGKRNEVYDDPRQVLETALDLKLVEMKRTRENSYCCGGGAGRVWTEDSPSQKRPSVSRVEEALELGAEIIATACPFCVSTLEDAIKVLDVENKITVKDIVELL